MSVTGRYLDRMVGAYLECALWSSVDEDGEPLDGTHGPADVSDEAMTQAYRDCADFAEACADDLSGMTPEQAGRDLWLTRNGHGAGFWDRGLGERGERLSDAARAYGSVDLYVGDDGQVWSL